MPCIFLSCTHTHIHTNRHTSLSFYLSLCIAHFSSLTLYRSLFNSYSLCLTLFLSFFMPHSLFLTLPSLLIFHSFYIVNSRLFGLRLLRSYFVYTYELTLVQLRQVRCSLSIKIKGKSPSKQRAYEILKLLVCIYFFLFYTDLSSNEPNYIIGTSLPPSIRLYSRSS